MYHTVYYVIAYTANEKFFWSDETKGYVTEHFDLWKNLDDCQEYFDTHKEDVSAFGEIRVMGVIVSPV